jgi:hypothetical protein
MPVQFWVDELLKAEIARRAAYTAVLNKNA